MPRVHVVVADPDKAHAFELRKYTDAYVRAGARVEAAGRLARDRVGEARPKDTVHAADEDLDCPDGLPNCRNCGDPDHAATCQAAGHCPHCGTRHGIAPDAVLAAHGMVLQPVP